jgi:hypothetical protein
VKENFSRRTEASIFHHNREYMHDAAMKVPR